MPVHGAANRIVRPPGFHHEASTPHRDTTRCGRTMGKMQVHSTAPRPNSTNPAANTSKKKNTSQPPKSSDSGFHEPALTVNITMLAPTNSQQTRPHTIVLNKFVRSTTRPLRRISAVH